jgi:hypothetical protein
MMKRWIFFGRVLPERLPQVIVNVSITKGDPDLHTLRNLVESNIRFITDTIGYLEGLSFDIDMISAASLDTGDRCIFGTGIPVLQDRRKSSGTLRQLSERFLATVGNDLHAQMVLADFKEAIRVPVGTGFFCYRAVEAMMQSMKVAEKEDEKVLWPRLRERLRVDRNAIMYLKSHADFPRHGQPSAISDEQRTKVFVITDEIIRRFWNTFYAGRQLFLKQSSRCCATDGLCCICMPVISRIGLFLAYDRTRDVTHPAPSAASSPGSA